MKQFNVGDMIYLDDNITLHTPKLIIVQRNEEEWYDNWRLATDADLASMGLVLRKDIELAVQEHFASFAPEPTPAEPHLQEAETVEPEPHVRKFEVGDEVKIVRSTPWHARNLGSTGFVGEVGVLEKSGSEAYDWTVRIRPDVRASCMSADLVLIAKEAEPQHHVWQVGDFALCPDGKVRRILTDGYTHHIDYLMKDCAPVPKPPMPELPDRMCFNCDGRIIYSNIYATLESWIVFFEMNNADKDMLSKLRALAAWRKLMGLDWEGK